MTDLNQLLSQLNELVLANPDVAKDVFAQHPEQVALLVKHQRQQELAEKCHEISPDGYAAWYELKYGFEPPKHVKREIRKIFEDHSNNMGTVVFASRGSWKTVSISVTLTEWFVGNHPHLTNLIVCANDDSAEKVTKAVAATIEFHPVWKLAFPGIVPDKGKWSTEGFNVINENMDRDEWAKLVGARVDPTFVGGGYKSTRLNGKHPTGLLIMDDLHDINNSMSQKERQAVVMALTTIILKTVVREDDALVTWVVDVGTPWALDDAHHVMRDSGSYGYIGIPAMTAAEEGAEGAIYLDGVNKKTGAVYEDIEGWWVLTWPERFGEQSIMQERSLGKSQFWQMIMLDLGIASQGGLRYYAYYEDVDRNMPALGGCDPTTFSVNSVTKNNEHSHFALGYAVKDLRTNKLIIDDGILEQCTMLQAENHIIAAQGMFTNWGSTYVEDVSVGRVALAAWQRNPRMKVLASSLNMKDVKGVEQARITDKKQRMSLISRYFEDGSVLISNKDTPFLNALRRLFDNFHDLDPKSHDPAWDAGDAVFHIVKNALDFLVRPVYSEKELRLGKKIRQKHPLMGIGDYRGYGQK